MATQRVVAPPARTAMFLVMTVNEGSEAVVRDFLTDFSSLTRAVGYRAEDTLDANVGIGALAWDRVFSLPRPARLHAFQEISGPRHTAPATPGDLFVHLRARHIDICFEMARQIALALDGAVEFVDEVHGFKFFDERDLLGFVDGSQNPEGPGANAAALIGAEDPAYSGGSYVIIQKYLHDLSAWDSLPVEQQERVIGRSKLDDIEMAELPVNSHVAVNTIVGPDGVAREIFRENMPFGNISEGEFGTFFIGYASDPGVTELMLHRMFIGDPPGNTDRILDFSTAHTGCLFFVPSLDFLDSLPGGDAPTVTAAQIAAIDSPTGAASSSVPESTTPTTTPSGSGDLGIGSLRRGSGSSPSAG